ncbi:DUF397 domain-containing protein [Actinoplanes lutulentus]|nr:DUF397 domain-containing protein [Actinoplanes lutulentus]
MTRSVEPTSAWTRSTFCADSACVEVAVASGGNVLVRDSKNPDQPYLSFTRQDWAVFVENLAGDSRSRREV